jgi:presenilin-like A22 family membrane protease
MKRDELKRIGLGIGSMALGLILFVSAAHFTAAEGLDALERGALAAFSATGGGVMTFIVSRRLLTEPRDE